MTELEKIYREYHGKVLGYLRNKINSPAIAEDLCSDVFLKITERIDSFDEQKASLSTWVYCIMRNTLYDYFRTRHEPYELDENMTSDDDFVEKLCNDDMLERLADALETLPRRERELIIRRYYYGQTLKDIAKHFDVSLTYVYVIQKSALKKLKNFFE